MTAARRWSAELVRLSETQAWALRRLAGELRPGEPARRTNCATYGRLHSLGMVEVKPYAVDWSITMRGRIWLDYHRKAKTNA